MKYEKKKVALLAGALTLVICVGVVNNKVNNEASLKVSSEYVNYEQQEMQLHDGEVLVDSLNVTQVPGKSTDDGEQKDTESKKVPEDALVTSDDVQELSNADAYFDEVRATINMDRNEILSMLTSVIEETEAEPEKNNATQQKLKIVEYMNQENVIEKLIKNKGYDQSLVLITDSSVNVTVNKQELTQTDVAKICDIVMRETGRNAEQIVIQSKF